MDQEKIGKFIAKCRKDKKLTQAQLAEKLGISNRSISKWENGICMPDLSLFKQLCKELDISINELLSGEKIDEKTYQQKFEENMISSMDLLEQKIKKNILRKVFKIIIILIFIIFLLKFSNYLIYKYNSKRYYLDIEDINYEICKKDDDIILSITANEYRYLYLETYEPVLDNTFYYKTYITRGSLKDKNIYNMKDIRKRKLKFKNDVNKIYINNILIYDNNKLLQICK